MKMAQFQKAPVSFPREAGSPASRVPIQRRLLPSVLPDRTPSSPLPFFLHFLQMEAKPCRHPDVMFSLSAMENISRHPEKNGCEIFHCQKAPEPSPHVMSLLLSGTWAVCPVFFRTML